MQLKLRAARSLANHKRIEVKNIPKFLAALEQNWSQWTDADPGAETSDQLWDKAKTLLTSAVKTSEQPTQTRERQHWMSDTTLALVEERRSMKALGADVRTLNELSGRIQAACRRDLNNQLRNMKLTLTNMKPGISTRKSAPSRKLFLLRLGILRTLRVNQ